MNLKCTQCSWVTDEKHFGYVDREDLNLCILCYSGETDRARNNAMKTRKEIDNAK